MKGDFIVIKYVEWEYAYTEIVPIDRARLKNPNPPVDKNTFYKIEIDVPEELRE